MNPRVELYKSELLKWTQKVNLIGPEARAHLDDHIAEPRAGESHPGRAPAAVAIVRMHVRRGGGRMNEERRMKN